MKFVNFVIINVKFVNFVIVSFQITVSIYGIHHWRFFFFFFFFRSSYRKLAWVGFEPTTTEFRSDALTDWAMNSTIYIYIYIYIYAIITICQPPAGYHHNSFVATHAIGHIMYGYIVGTNETKSTQHNYAYTKLYTWPRILRSLLGLLRTLSFIGTSNV